MVSNNGKSRTRKAATKVYYNVQTTVQLSIKQAYLTYVYNVLLQGNKSTLQLFYRHVMIFNCLFIKTKTRKKTTQKYFFTN